MTGNEILEKQKMRDDIVAEIHEEYPNKTWPTPVLEPIFFGRFDKQEVLGRKLMLDKNTGNQFDIVSDQYELIYHEEVLHNLLNAIPPEFGEPKVNIRMFKDGARASFSIIFPEMKLYEINGSETQIEYRLKNSYDRSAYLNYSAGLMELICTNGLRAFHSKDNGKAKHIGETISSFALENRLKDSLEDISKSHNLWLQWARKGLSEIESIAMVEALPYSEKEIETLLTLPILNHGSESISTLKNKNTIWSIMSAGTQMVHEIKSEERQLDLEEKIPVAIINHLSSRRN